MDALVDSDDPLSEEVAQQAYRDLWRLLASGERGVFQDKYRDALQESPDIGWPMPISGRSFPSEIASGSIQSIGRRNSMPR